MQERRNSIANALELRLSCTNPSICDWTLTFCTGVSAPAFSTRAPESLSMLHTVTTIGTGLSLTHICNQDEEITVRIYFSLTEATVSQLEQGPNSPLYQLTSHENRLLWWVVTVFLVLLACSSMTSQFDRDCKNWTQQPPNAGRCLHLNNLFRKEAIYIIGDSQYVWFTYFTICYHTHCRDIVPVYVWHSELPLVLLDAWPHLCRSDLPVPQSATMTKCEQPDLFPAATLLGHNSLPLSCGSLSFIKWL